MVAPILRRSAPGASPRSTAVNSILAEARQIRPEGRDVVSIMRGEYTARRARVIERLSRIAGARVPRLEAGLFAMLDVRGLRVSFASGGQTLQRGLDRLREGLARIAV